MKESQLKTWWIVLLLITISVYITGLFATVMDVDAAQYAAISREMYLHHDYLQTHCSNDNYLDKPPLLFWLSIISFHIFGIHTWSYKLPSLLFTLIGLYATYKLAERLYNKQTARYASLILATCQAYFLFNTDVRTDTILTASIIVSIWQLYLFVETKKWIHALVGFTFVATGMLAKGPLGACVPALALASQLAYQRRWKVFLWPAWWLGLGYALLLLCPMVYGLYEQYGWKGPEFFFWYQSFGRITGANEWHNNAGYFFFVHTFLWAFLPWTFFAILSLWDRLRLLIKIKFQYNTSVELLTYGGFIISFIAFSFSHYKLPHYIFNVFPLAAIFTAANFDSLITRYKWLAILQKITLILLLLILILLITYLFPLNNVIIWAGIAILIFASIRFLFRRNSAMPAFILLGSATCILAVNVAMNAHFYPTILTYQSGSNLGRYISEHNIPTQRVCNYNYSSYSEDFYAGVWIAQLNLDSMKHYSAIHQPYYIAGRDELLPVLDSNNIPYRVIYQTSDYSVTLLKLKFLSPPTRQSVVGKMYFVKLQ
jgi:4-amino-4-deoxy-L-arabinose transferase-like glycosyltransferase